MLYALRTNEDDTNTAYELATRFESLSPGARQVIERARNDERRHREWISATLKEM